MARVVLAVGAAALRQAVEILGRGAGAAAQWGGDRMVLSHGPNGVRFMAGSILYEQDRESFLREEAAVASATQPAWLRGLSRHETPFCMGLAGALIPAWGDSSVCAFLDRFGAFYAGNRARLDLAARDLRFVLDGLLAAQHWPALFGALIGFVGNPARGYVAASGSPAGLGAFLGGVLLGSRGGVVPLYRLPDCLRGLRDPATPEVQACLRVPHYARMLDNLERAAERVAPVLRQLARSL